MNYTLKKKKATPLPPKNPKHTTKKTTTKKHKGKLLTKKQELNIHERHLELLDYRKTNKKAPETKPMQKRLINF